MAPAGEMVAVRGLARSFGEKQAVAGLDFTVARGELFGLVGPDGAGKTTTLRMLAGVLKPSSGDALLAGRSVVKEPEAVKPHLAYMSQRFGLYADLTVAENIDFYAALYRVPKAEKEATLERLYEFSNLGPFKDRLAGALSGGMKQKLGLSCALIHQPEILLLDEPTFGVDPISRRELWRIVHERVEGGMTAIVSTSYLDEAERFDRLALLDQGTLLATGTPAELAASLEGALFEVAAAAPREAARKIEKIAGVEAALLFGERLHVLVESEAAAGFEAALAGLGLGGLKAARIEPGLEDVFLLRFAPASREAA
jgi:ABC-2 type transport system ATP-binding protein